jgi:YHS domain-containing protein
MFRYFILEILVPILIFTFLRSILRSLFQSKRTVERPVMRNDAPPSQPSVVSGGELKKDPVCGTYVSAGASVTTRVDGQLVHFCSTACRDKYRAA